MEQMHKNENTHLPPPNSSISITRRKPGYTSAHPSPTENLSRVSSWYNGPRQTMSAASRRLATLAGERWAPDTWPCTSGAAAAGCGFIAGQHLTWLSVSAGQHQDARHAECGGTKLAIAPAAGRHTECGGATLRTSRECRPTLTHPTNLRHTLLTTKPNDSDIRHPVLGLKTVGVKYRQQSSSVLLSSTFTDYCTLAP